MKKIKDIIKNLKGIYTIIYLFANIEKLTNFQKNHLLAMSDDVKNKRITLDQFTDEIIILKNNLKIK